MTEREVMKKYQDKVDSYQTAIYLRENPKADKMERQKINDLKEKLEELKLIANALDKQVAKKPNKFDGYQCVLYNKRLARQTDLINQAYCHHCGSKADWSEEE